MRELNFIRKINIWRVKNVDEKKFVFFLSILIGFIAGLAAVLLKTSVHYIETFFRNYKNIQIQNEYYIILPFIGILITVLFIRFFIKDDISHGVTKILYAISRKNSKINN